jgi:quercetin dioxygenase-like cupin family protein
MKTDHSLEEAQERAALYALGSLPPEESSGFEEHLGAGCDVCARELASFTQVVDELAVAAPPGMPADRVRAAVLERFAAAEFEAMPGMRFVRSDRLAWQPGSQPTVSVKLLSRDAPSGYRTQVIRMAPNSSIQPHRHAEVEELYLLEGEVTISGVVMRAGDYCRAEAGTVHDAIFTKTGCVFLALSSENDERLSQ